MNKTLEEALRLAGLGYPVFPCAPGKKTPLTPNGFKAATTDPATIQAWFEKWPEANLAMATSGLVVIDMDKRESPWWKTHGSMVMIDAGAFSCTPRLGGHFFFRDNGPTLRSCSASKVGPDIDVRANGGYVLVAPSKVDGKPYRWIRPLQKKMDELPAVPGWLKAELDGPDRPSPDLKPDGGDGPKEDEQSEQIDDASPISEGYRNDTLARIAGALRRKGLSESEMEAALQEINRRRCNPPLDEKEVGEIAKSIGRYPPGNLPGGCNLASADGRQEIVLSPDEYVVVDEAVAALAKDADIFSRGNVLVRIQHPDAAPGSQKNLPTIGQLPSPTLRERLTKVALIQKYDKNNDLKQAHPPGWLVNAVEARGNWPGIRPIAGIADAPILRWEGSVWFKSGYDPVTGVFLVPCGDFPALPDWVRPEHAAQAVSELEDVLSDFKFQAPEHKSAWFAYLLTIIGRFAFEGCSPLFLIDANIRGAGKGLLAQVASMIATGRQTAVSSGPNEVEETRKMITTVATSGDRIVLFDNVEGKFGNEALDRALTCTMWRDRILGTSTHVSLPLKPVWVATGNNVIVAADTARRIVPIRLDVMCEKPEERTGFKYPNLLEHVADNRVRLYTAALTILAAYLHAGGPDLKLQPYGSFEGWSGLVRSAVVFAGMVDPCIGRKQLAEQSDSSHEALATMIDVWAKVDPGNDGVVVSKFLAELYSEATAMFSKDDAVTVRAAIESLPGVSGGGKVPTARQVGNALRRFRRRVISGVYLDTDATQESSAGKKWRRFDADTGKPLQAQDGVA